jgi:hypothetical protein
MRTKAETYRTGKVKNARSEMVRLTITIAALLTAPGAPANGARFIPMPPTFASGGVPQQVIAADMNRDGRQDLIVSNDNGKATAWRAQ